MNHNSVQQSGTVALFAVIAVTLGPNLALAHTGANPAHDLLHGVQHPLTGLDHMLAMFAVGLWAAQRGGRAIWLVPLTFVAVMTVGSLIGMSGARLPFAEQGILLSVVLLGVLVAAAVRLPLPISAAIIGLFALAHGYAHGVEIPPSASGLSYILGFTAATLLLHVAGIAFGLAMQRAHSAQVVRLAGVATAISGLYLIIR